MNRHPFDALSFALGWIVLFTSSVHLFDFNIDIDESCLLPVALLVAGLGVLAKTMRRARAST